MVSVLVLTHGINYTMDDSTKQIIAALHALHGPTSNESIRQQANIYLDSFKSAQPPQLQLINQLIIFQYINNEYTIDINIIRHYGLLCVETIIIQQWNKLNDNDKLFLKKQSIDLLLYCIQLQSSNHTIPLYVKTKFISITVQIILREYPQHYNDLHEQLYNIIQQYGAYGTELVIFIYRSVCDEIVNYSGTLPEKRRRDIQTSIINNMSTLYQLFYDTLQHTLTQYTHDKSQLNESIILNTIDTIRYISDFIHSNYLFDSSIIELCCSQLNNVEFYSSLMELLDAIIHRKTQSIQSTNYYIQIVQLCRVVCQSIQSLLQMTHFHSQSLFLHRTLAVLTDIIKFHSPLLHPTEYDTTKQLVLITLEQLLRDNKYDISVVAVELFTYIIRSTANHVILDSYSNSVIPELVNTTSIKLQKPLKSGGDDSEFDDDTDQMKHDFGTYRGALLHLLTALADKYPHHTLNVALNKYQQLDYNQLLDHINPRNYVSTESTLYRYIESLGAMLDTTMRCITFEQLQNDTNLLGIVEQLLHTIINHTTSDPLLLTLKLHDISIFTTLFNVKPLHIQTILPVLFDGIVFQSNVSYYDQHEDVRATRKRAIYTLIAMGRKCSRHIQSILTQLTDTVMNLVSTQQIADVEKILLYEFLITTSQSMSDQYARQQFILQLITPAIQYITSNQLPCLFNSTDSILALLGANDISTIGNAIDVHSANKALISTKSKQQRSDTLNTINTLISVYKPIFGNCTTLQPGDAIIQHPILSQIAVQLLPNIITTLNFMCSYRSYNQQLPDELKLLMCGSNEQLQMQIDSPDDKQYILVTDVKRWLDRMMDSVCTLLSLLFKTGNNIYGMLQSSHIHQSITNNIKYLHHFQLRHIHDKLLLSLYQSSVPAVYDILLTNVTIALFNTLSQRYISDWNVLKQQQSNNSITTNNVSNEIYEESQLRESSHTCIDILFRNVIEFDHLHIHELHAANHVQPAATNPTPINGTSSNKSDTKVTHSLTEHQLFYSLMSNINSAKSVLQLCNTMLHVPDSVTQHRAIIVSIRLLVFLTSQSYPSLLSSYIDIMNNTLIVLSSIVVNDTNQLELDLIDYIKELYIVTNKLQCCDDIITVLTRHCNLPYDIINNINESILVEMSDKKYRLLFKNILRQYVIGKHTTLSGTKSNTIHNINESVPVHSHINAALKQQNQLPVDPTNLANLFQ